MRLRWQITTKVDEFGLYMNANPETQVEVFEIYRALETLRKYVDVEFKPVEPLE